MAYTKRTCHKCGFRNDQPNMVKKTMKVASGQSKSSPSRLAILKGALGDKAANKAVDRSYYASVRNYSRNKQVWMCRNGCANNFQPTSPKNISTVSPHEFVPIHKKSVSRSWKVIKFIFGFATLILWVDFLLS